MNTSGSFSLKRSWKNTSGSDTYDEISTKRLKSDYVSGISQDHFNVSNPIIGPPNTQLDGNEKPGQMRFKYYTEAQKGLLQVYDGSEWVSLNELEDSSLWHLSDNVVSIKNNYKLNLTNDLIVKGDLIVKDIRIPSAMTFYANTSTDPIISYGYYDSQLGQYMPTASINLYNGNITANIKPKSVLPDKHIKTDENGELVAAPNSACLSTIDQILSINSEVEFKSIKISPSLSNTKLILWETSSLPNDKYSIGINNSNINFHVIQDHSSFVFYKDGSNGDGTEIFRIKGNGQIITQSDSSDLDNSGLVLQNNYSWVGQGGIGIGNQIKFKHRLNDSVGNPLGIYECGNISIYRESKYYLGDSGFKLQLRRTDDKIAGGDGYLFDALHINSNGVISQNSNSADLNNTGLRLINNYAFDHPADALGVGNKISFYHSCRSGENWIMESAKIEVKRESGYDLADTYLQLHLLRSENRSTGEDRQLKKALQLNSLGQLEVNELFLKNLIISEGDYALMLTGEDRVVKYSSSKKYKENIKTISPDISDDILNLNIKEFNYIDTPEKKSIGYIAEEVHESCPNIREYIISYLPVDKIPEKYKNKLQRKDIYTKNKKEVTPDAINYQILTILLIEQIKKQKSEINNLKEQLSTISNTVQELINIVNNLPQNQ